MKNLIKEAFTLPNENKNTLKEITTKIERGEYRFTMGGLALIQEETRYNTNKGNWIKVLVSSLVGTAAFILTVVITKSFALGVVSNAIAAALTWFIVSPQVEKNRLAHLVEMIEAHQGSATLQSYIATAARVMNERSSQM